MLQEAIEVLETQEPGPELARAYSAMAGHRYVAGENRAALPWADKALALADELGMEGEAVLALQYRGAARAQAGDSGGLEDLREALRRGLELGPGTETSIAYNNLAYQLWFWRVPRRPCAFGTRWRRSVVSEASRRWRRSPRRARSSRCVRRVGDWTRCSGPRRRCASGTSSTGPPA